MRCVSYGRKWHKWIVSSSNMISCEYIIVMLAFWKHCIFSHALVEGQIVTASPRRWTCSQRPETPAIHGREEHHCTGQSPYLPDLPPCDIFLFSKLKDIIETCFEGLEAIPGAVTIKPRGIQKEPFQQWKVEKVPNTRHFIWRVVEWHFDPQHNSSDPSEKWQSFHFYSNLKACLIIRTCDSTCYININ